MFVGWAGEGPSFCDLDAPVCPGAGQVCSAWFVDPVPPQYADVGVCLLP
ncbi:MAG: hypothetical protein JNK56_36735 [Myxococcales bacterium]|nr:hypothetical protein [Myxococcales bacterium]